MKRLGTIPIYFETQDQRIKDYLIRNINHHQLVAEQKPESNGHIRHALAGAVIAPVILVLMWCFLAFGEALTMEIPQ
jgi:hypothetical protein